MIEVRKEDYKNYKQQDAAKFYKQNLQGKKVINPTLGEIIFTSRGIGETIHRVKRNLHPFIFILKELIETGNCDGQLEALYKTRKDRITGFYHIKNQVKLAFIKLNLDILIAQDQDGNKYWMFKKDPQGYLGEDFSSQRGPSGSNNIITEKDQKINGDIENPKVGDVFWLGDCLRIEVISVDPDYKELNNQLQEYMED